MRIIISFHLRSIFLFFFFCQVACRWFPWLKCSVFTSYVRAPATFSPAQQDRVQVARAERRWNTGVEHRITNVGVANNARSTVVAATGELETRRDRFGTPCSIHDVLISRYTCTRCISFFLFFPPTEKREFCGWTSGSDSETAIVPRFMLFQAGF